jgi:hypothetical protein
MTQSGRDWDDKDGDGPDETSEWLRPVWAEDDADLDAPPLRRSLSPLPRPARATPATDVLLAPLAAAAAALARLDAQAEAAGWLASQGITAHLVSLALRDHERVGRRELWLQHKALRPRRSVPVWEQDDAWLDADDKITRALALARLLERLPAAENPLVDAARAEAWLALLAPQACPFDAHHFGTWRAAHAPDARRPDPRPALLRAAEPASPGWRAARLTSPMPSRHSLSLRCC